MEEYEKEVEIIDYLNIIWQKKWLIIIPTFLIVVCVALYSFTLPKVWEVQSILSPSKFWAQTESGQYNEIIVVKPQQIAGQINEGAYTSLIAAELNLDIQKFPKLKAEPLKNTNLIKISLKAEDVNEAKAIEQSLFQHIKGQLDKKIDVEMKSVDTSIENNESQIRLKELNIKDTLNEIKLSQIEKTQTFQMIQSTENKLKISEEREKAILNELKAVKKKTDELEIEQKKSLSGAKKESDAISLLLYSNEVQTNLRYYDTLNEKLSIEKITQENLNLLKKEKTEEIKIIETKIDKAKNEIKKIENKIIDIKVQIQQLKEEKLRIDYSKLIKEPTSSIGPVSPKKKQMVLLAGFISLMLFTFLAFFIHYIQEQKKKT